MTKFAIKSEKAKRLAANIFFPLLALSLALAIWAIWAAAKNMPNILPPPAVVLKEFFTLGGSGAFWRAAAATVIRTLLCFLLSFFVALALASIAGACKPFARAFAPIVSILRSAPTVAVILIVYVFMNKHDMTLAVGFLIAFPILYSSFLSAIDGVNGDVLEMAKIYKVRTVDKIFSIYLPSVAGTLFDTSAATVSLTLKVVVSAEIIVNLPVSIGHNVQIANSAFEISGLFAWTIVAVAFSFALEGAVLLAKKLWEAKRCK